LFNFAAEKNETMFYKLIEKKRNQWLESPDCTVKDLLRYIHSCGKLRDAQIQAVQTYLFLKVKCSNKPLHTLFSEGYFNSGNTFTGNTAAEALYEYSKLTDKNEKPIAPKLKEYVSDNIDGTDYTAAFKRIFYGVEYPDYIFSLPMGAGKTFLMAAFIYLDLYFAQNEPDNPAFAHNFMILAPSGLKSSIVPSLKKIRNFDPSWVIPEPSASQIKKILRFEILDEQKSAAKSNKIKNPNARKIVYGGQSLEDMFGLVAVTNAEKVILNKMDKGNELMKNIEDKETLSYNELRNIIGKIPNLAVYIDEVHHASDGEIKLRQVVTQWAKNSKNTSVLGFSGTPYLEKQESVAVSNDFSLKNSDLANVVYHYPLINGIGNFLKIPSVKIADSLTENIVENGVKDFLNNYKNTVYSDGTCAKLAIYCGTIETLEETIFPLVSQILSSYKINPTETILKYHGGNKNFPKPDNSEIEFAALDTPLSKIKIILLVQIGKEGWDCKSLTGVILPQKGVCPTNMVLQTSCRCLRQVVSKNESALIWLNKFNSEKLNTQLIKQQNITLKEFADSGKTEKPQCLRYDRTERLKVPKVDFYQLKISYETLVIEENHDTAKNLSSDNIVSENRTQIVTEQNIEGKIQGYSELKNVEDENEISYSWWLHSIAKESFNSVSVNDLQKFSAQLEDIFNQITTEKDGIKIENPKYNHSEIRSKIRRAFFPKRRLDIKEEVIPQKAGLLQIRNGNTFSPVDDSPKFYPVQDEVKEIIKWDGLDDDPMRKEEMQKLVKQLSALGQDISALKLSNDPHPERMRTYHYLPYRFDSGLERQFFADEIIPLTNQKKLEIYFNGDESLTEFKIDCYSKPEGVWHYIGRYVPDFLLISRDNNGEIKKAIIIETKGSGFAANFAAKKLFMQNEFIPKNNEKFGYRRFEFLYLEDTLNHEERVAKTMKMINDFFEN